MEKKTKYSKPLIKLGYLWKKKNDFKISINFSLLFVIILIKILLIKLN